MQDEHGTEDGIAENHYLKTIKKMGKKKENEHGTDGRWGRRGSKPESNKKKRARKNQDEHATEDGVAQGHYIHVLECLHTPSRGLPIFGGNFQGLAAP